MFALRPRSPRRRLFGGIVYLPAALVAIVTPCHAQTWTSLNLTPAGFDGGFLTGITPDGRTQVGNALLGDSRLSSRRAFVFHGDAASAAPLTPVAADFSTVEAVSADGTRYVGSAAFRDVIGVPRPVLWNGSASDYAAFLGEDGQLNSVSGDGRFQGGYSRGISVGGYSGARLYQGTEASGQYLQPPLSMGFYNFSVISALSGDGSVQAGMARLQTLVSIDRPALWRGSRESFVDLSPTPSGSGQVTGITADGLVQVGYYGTFLNSRAALWRGSAASFVDLTPPDFTGAQLYGVSANGRWAVGVGGNDRVGSAFILDLSLPTPSAVNLIPFLPAVVGGYDTVFLTGVSDNGDVVGNATPHGQALSQAILWRRVAPAAAAPEPGTAFLLALGGLSAAGRLRSRRGQSDKRRRPA